MYKLIGIVSVLAVVACGGDSGSGPLSMSEARNLCADVCEWEDGCGMLDTAGGETVASCTNECAIDLGGGGYRADVLEDSASCVTALACTANEGNCLQCSPTSAHDAYETACREKLAECGAAGSAADNLCETTLTQAGDTGFVCIFTPAVADDLRACFGQSCDMIETCMEAVFVQYNIDT